MNIIKKVKGFFQKDGIYGDDTFLVSYPKSGNTWVRFILSNLLKTNSDEVVDFHTSINYIPEYGVHLEAIENLKRPRILKSHSLFNSNYPSIIYLIRDPRDVYVSYYHYLKNKIGGDFSDFLRKTDLFPSRWNEHVVSWEKHDSIEVFKYEDLINDPIKTITAIAEFAGLNCNRKEIEQAVNASSFENMRSIEMKRGRPFLTGKDEKQSSTFVRKGTVGDWKNVFSSKDMDFLLEVEGDVMMRYGYL